MMPTRRDLLAGGMSLVAASRAAGQSAESGLRQAARIAALYFIPIYRMYALRWADTVDETNGDRLQLNRLVHRDQRRADTLTSRAWLDLSQESLFLTIPPLEGRYYDIALVDMAGRCVNLSRRFLGARPPPHMIVGPASTEGAQRGLVQLRARSNSLLLQYRLQTFGNADIEAGRALQRRLLLETPDMRNERRMIEMRELIRQRTVLPPEPVADWLPPDRNDPFDLFTVGAQVLAELDPPVADPAMAQALDLLRIKPRRRYDRWNVTATDRSLILAGIADAWTLARDSETRFTRRVDGWQWPVVPDPNPDDLRLHRAVSAEVDPAAPEAEETIVATCEADRDGQPLTGDRRYVIRLPDRDEPLAHACWLLSAVRMADDGTADESAFSTVSHRGPGLGGPEPVSVLYLQAEPPTGHTATSWLRLPPGRFRLLWHLCEPSRALLAAAIAPPPVVPA